MADQNTPPPARAQATPRHRPAVLVLAGALALSGCSLSGSGDDSGEGSAAAGATGSGATDRGTVTLLTHSSFTVEQKLLDQFKRDTGYTVKVSKIGDAGELANKIVLTKDAPLGDAVFGIDNTFASRVTGAQVLAQYRSGALASSAARYDLPGSGKAQLTPIDHAATCVNVDTAWFAKKGINPPASFDDLLKPQYKNLFVAPGPPTSSPGLAMLLATVGKYGEGWQDYWKKLAANGAKFTSGWEDAYNVDFTQGEGKGGRPIVWSYDTSPAFTVSGGKSTTSALLNTCFEQVEYAGVLRGAKNPAGAKALIDWMSGKTFQASLPESMYVFPVDQQVALPADWKKFAVSPTDPITVSPNEIEKNRQTWLTQWQSVATE